jgi:hypothetical protein
MIRRQVVGGHHDVVSVLLEHRADINLACQVPVSANPLTYEACTAQELAEADPHPPNADQP